MSRISIYVVLLSLAFGYYAGYKRAVEQQAEQIRNIQQQYVERYEKQIKNLSRYLDDLRRANDDRMRELERFKAARTDLDTCTRERADLAQLAVEGEKLLKEADAYIKTNQGVKK